MIYGIRHMIYASRMIYACGILWIQFWNVYYIMLAQQVYHICISNISYRETIYHLNDGALPRDCVQVTLRYALCDGFLCAEPYSFFPFCENYACANIVRNQIAVGLFSQWGYPCVSLGIIRYTMSGCEYALTHSKSEHEPQRRRELRVPSSTKSTSDCVHSISRKRHA